MKEQLEQYVKNVKELHSLCANNEAVTKSSLIAPLFTILGWNTAHPKECIPEYKADFGQGQKSVTPMDWMFSLQNTFAFIVEAKAADKKLKSYTEQLGMYFAKTSVNLGILTSGVHWQFYTDLDKSHIMDKEPFLSWDILADDPLPFDFLTILQKQEFKPQLVTTFAERGRKQNLLVNELNQILAPSPEFVKMAIQNIESGKVNEKVISQWTPILANAIQAWVKLKALDMALARPNKFVGEEEAKSWVSLEGFPSPTKAPKPFKGKSCPSCNASGLGYRTQKCKCGHVFTTPEETTVEEPQTLKMPEPPPKDLSFSCKCGQTFKVKSEFSGRICTCPKCKQQLIVPATQVS
jgi:hypothetical protein